jgi:hypothetical protein
VGAIASAISWLAPLRASIVSLVMGILLRCGLQVRAACRGGR